MLLDYAPREKGQLLARWCAHTSLSLGIVVTLLPAVWYLGLIELQRWIAWSASNQLSETSSRVIGWPEGVILAISAAGVACGAAALRDSTCRRLAGLGMVGNGVALGVVLMLGIS
jgi:hypothetical protein